MNRRHFLCAGLSTIALGGCSAIPVDTLRIDRSHSARYYSSRIQTVIIHYTALDDAQSLKILTQDKVSSHYLITREPNARILQLVDEQHKAWHAGDSTWYGQSLVNSTSIGIEIVNKGRQADDSWQPYTEAQITALTALLKDVVERHGIKPQHIVGHSDVAPYRKQDPGPLFPWEQLARQGLGRWYDTQKAQRYAQEFQTKGLPSASWIQQELLRVGYNAPTSQQLDKRTREVIRAFQLHYRPMRHDGTPDAQTLGILKALT